MKYIVYWVLTQFIPAPCPDAIKTNEFGFNNSNVFTSCAVLHFERKDTSHKREFVEKDSAFAFYNRAKEQSKITVGLSIMNTTINNIKIDSIYGLK